MKWKKPARLILVMVFFAGGGLFFDHIASYGWAFHLAWIDHGVAGLIMIVASLIGALAIFRWRKGE